MIKRLLPSFAIAGIFLLGACSTSKLAQQEDEVDDAYYTEAQAREYERTHAKAEEKIADSDYVTDEELYGDNNSGGDYYDRYDYDRDYSARIYRFRNYSPWRSYYDTWYSYRFDPYYSPFNSYNYYNRPAVGIYIGTGGYYGYNSYNNFYNPWAYYGYHSYSNYWGPYSYYNVYNPYSFGNRYYGNHGGGYYGNGSRPVYTNPNYRPRPNRETDNTRPGAYPGTAPGTAAGRVGTTPSRPERISRGSGDGSSTVDRSSQPASRPTRGTDGRDGTVDRSTRPAPAPQRTESSRPSRQEPQRTESRPAERQQSQPSSTPQRSSEPSSSARPSRSGGR
ncbi:hypothetical protein GZH53_06525 [Flavihumibacter sp. R14]|nr:hypothetical protein [Flavihumibacter soli]